MSGIGASKIFLQSTRINNGIKLTKKSIDTLYHLDKNDHQRQEFKDRIINMNQQVNNIKNTIDSLIKQKKLDFQADNPLIKSIK